MQQTSLVANDSSSSCHTTSIRSSDHDASQGLKLLWTPVRMAISIVQSTYAQFCALPSQTRQCSLSLLHMSLANGQAFLEVSGNVWCYFFHSVVAAINVGGPPPMRYRIGGSKFYEGVAILVTGAIPSDDAIEMNESIGARVINQLWSLGYTVVMLDIPSSTTTTTATSNDNHAATDASTSSQTKHRPKFIKRHSTSGGRVMRISSVILEKTLERLRKHRIILAAVVHMAAESASATQVNHSALDSLAHDLLSSNVEQQGQASALNRNTKNNNNKNNNNDNDNGDGKTGYLRRSSIDAATTAINAVSKPYSLPSASASASSSSALASTHRAEIEWRHATIWAQRTLPHLIHTGGRIVFLNAPVSLAASPADRACAEQIAVLARQLRAELAKENISVSLVQPDDLVYDVNRPHTLVDCFATPTLQAASAVEHAVGACWPRRRYAVGWSVRLLDALHRIMGEAVADGLTTMTSTLLEMKRARDERMNQAAQQYQQQRQQHDKYHHSTVEQSSSLAMLTTTTTSSTSASTSNHHYNNNDDDDDDEEGEAMEMEHGRIVNVSPNEQEYSMVSGSFTTPHLTSTPNTSTLFKRQNKPTTCKQPSMPLLSSRSSLSSSLSSQRHRDGSKSSILDTRTSSSVVII